MNAKEMFENLGYGYIDNSSKISIIEMKPYGSHIIIEFNYSKKWWNYFICKKKINFKSEISSMLIAAIFKQCQELGWLE